VSNLQRNTQWDADAEPSSANGQESGDRDERGRFAFGNRAAVTTGARSQAFWRAHAEARSAFVEAVLADRGFTPADAPRALLAAADGAAQAVLLRDSAFARIAESGGPMTLRGRRRAAFTVWQGACDRAEHFLRLVGLDRRARPVDPLTAIREAVAEANRQVREE
jgi:hypothetical protein